MTTNVTKLDFLKVKPILISIKEKQPYPVNHQDIDTYQQDVRWLLKANKITNKGDVYACQIAMHVHLEDFTSWEEINTYYKNDYLLNKIHFYHLLFNEKCTCGHMCKERFRFEFNRHYVHVGSFCINKHEIVGPYFKKYMKGIKRIITFITQYYKKYCKYLIYKAFKRFKFNNSKKILLKYRDKIVRRPLYWAFLNIKMKPKPIVKPIVKPIESKSIVEPIKPIVEPIKPIVEPIKPIVESIKGICVCGKKCGKYPRCSTCEIEHKKTLPYTCKCGVKSSYRCCYKCKQGISLVIF
jgi:hypothetical protein